MKSFYVLIVIFLLAFSDLLSQGTYLGGTYSASITVPGHKNYINAGSYKGANFEGLKEIGPKYALGWILGWNEFKEKRLNEVYLYDNQRLTGTQYRYMKLIPMLARGIYEFGVTGQTRTFIGSGVGFTADRTRTNIDLFSFQKSGWHFTVAPELGIKIPLGHTCITGSVRYLYGVRTAELSRISYFTLNIGLLLGV